MNVQIKTVFGEMSFDMTQENALSLINQAISYANGDTNNAPASRPNAAAPSCTTKQEKQESTATSEAGSFPLTGEDVCKQPRSRAETMFGDKSKWDMPAAEPRGNAHRDDGQEAYKGFLYIECESCGKVKGYYAKYPSTYYQCKCGHRTPLRSLRMAHVHCKCGNEFRYRTNLQNQEFTISCLSCGSPVDMELGAKGTAFVTVGH